MSAIMASLRTRFVSELAALADQPHRSWSATQPVALAGACFFTGHPVDVASGKVVTSVVDLELPGPIALTLRRAYTSSSADRKGWLGHGWSLSLEQAIWEEPGKVVYQAEDGREIEFNTFDLPGRRLGLGMELRHRVDRFTLRRDGSDEWSIRHPDGLIRHFAVLPDGPAGRALLQRITVPSGAVDILFDYAPTECSVPCATLPGDGSASHMTSLAASSP